MSSEAGRILGSNLLQTVTRADLPPELESSVSHGWVTVDGAVLLTNWYESYFGERNRFAETLDYEIAVNGRGIPDLDLTEEGEARVLRLIRRGVAFAWTALHKAHLELPGMKMISYISAAPTLVDPDYFTGNVTFCSVHSGRPLYIDPAHLTVDIVVAVFTDDCKQPMPEE